jgi:hypothetical protein
MDYSHFSNITKLKENKMLNEWVGYQPDYQKINHKLASYL